ncbi:MAG: hypothetical protein K9N38_07190 [Candidatus Marinimicrobia bacterium]|nr:hypothetical protein [Candidatus Neomarinimicrobiota bacterium]MCF7850909.1 hypothetical protein [Candidatus Neomarinimicrobiota bacterium]
MKDQQREQTFALRGGSDYRQPLRFVLGLLKVTILIAAVPLLISCDEQIDNGVASYQGERALELLEVTTSYTPEIQWLGGRVAAVGANEGSIPALDSTLVWISTSDENTISSYMKFGMHTDSVFIESVDGTVRDSLIDGLTYTFWIADLEAMENQLDTLILNDTIFDSRQMVANLTIPGIAGGEKNSSGQFMYKMNVFREETLIADQIILNWTPADVPFRRIAIREGRFGAFTNLIWHIVQPDSVTASIYPPVVIGSAPDGTDTAAEWPGTGFDPEKDYFIWMANDDWEIDFYPFAKGYAWFKLL